MELTTERRAELEARGGAIYRKALQENRKLNTEEEAEVRRIEGEIDRADYQTQHGGPGDAQKRFTAAVETRAQGNPLILTPEKRMRDFVRGRYPAEHEDLSLGKFIRGWLTGHWHEAELERRAMSEGTLSAGGHMVPTPLSATVIDKMRNLAMVTRAGATVVPMESQTLKLARLTTDPTAGWFNENATITASDGVFDAVTFTARKLAALVKLSVELVEDASNVTSLIEDTLAQVLALELDRVALHGTGTAPEPKGINAYSTTDVPEVSMGTNGAQLTSFDKLADTYFTAVTNNAAPTAAIFAPRTAQTIDKLKDTTNQPLVAPASWANLQKLVTNQVRIDLTQGTSNNASNVFLGDFSTVAVGMRTSLILEASREADTAFADGQVWIRAYLRADVQLLQGKKLCVLRGIIP